MCFYNLTLTDMTRHHSVHCYHSNFIIHTFAFDLGRRQSQVSNIDYTISFTNIAMLEGLATLDFNVKTQLFHTASKARIL